MIKFLKNLLKKEEKVESVKREDLKSWIEDKESQITDQLEVQISEGVEEIYSSIKRLRELIESLKEAELLNKNIPQREKNFMKGNREAYIKIADLFISDLSPEKTIPKIYDFLEHYEAAILDFTKSSSRAYSVLNHFFAEELSKISAEIKKIDDAARKIRKLIDDSGIEKISLVRDSIDKIKSKKIKRKELLEEEEYQTKEMESNSKRKDRLEREVTQAEESDEYIKVQEYKKEHNSLKSRLKRHEDAMNHHFAILEKALKKYSKIAMENTSLIENYSDNAIDTLLKDKDLKIISILEQLKISILKGSLGLKDKKKDKTESTIDILDKGFLEKFLEEHHTISKEIEDIDKKMSKILVLEQIKNNKKEIEFLDTEIKRCKDRIKELKSEQGKIDIQKIIYGIKEEIEKELKIKIEII